MSGCIDDPASPCRHDVGSHGPREIHDHPVSASQPLTGDELAAIKARAEALVRAGMEDVPGFDWGADVLRLVAEVERLRAQVERVEALAGKLQQHSIPGMTKWDYGADIRAALDGS